MTEREANKMEKERRKERESDRERQREREFERDSKGISRDEMDIMRADEKKRR